MEELYDKNEDKNKDEKIKETENKEKKMNICQICSKKYSKDQKLKCMPFDCCNHEICYICIYKLLIRSYIKSIAQIYNTNNKITMKCICQQGKKELSIKEIINILSSLNSTISYQNLEQNEKEENFKPNEIKCELHKDIPISMYCLECYEPICSKCIDKEKNRRKLPNHSNHKSVPFKEFYAKLYSHLLNIPNLKIILDNHKKKTDCLYENYCELINNKFESVLYEINYIKEKIINNLKKEYEKCKPAMEAINLLYQYYNYELISINKDTDINQLMFLYNTNISLPEFTYQISTTEIELNKIVKKLNESNFEKFIEYKFRPINAEEYKCIQTISDAHASNISNLCILNNKKIASGDYDGNIRIWKQSLNRYILSQEIKNIYKGVINSICNIYVNKFGVCSPLSNEINIYHENINTEQYINVQKIVLEEKDKFFNIIKTLNDNNSLIITTKDFYLYIYQDKIGGIPKQNYMNTEYELVESFETLHTKEINSMLHTKNENIVTASEDSTLKVWDKDRNYYTLTGHEDSVNVLIEIDNKYLATGSSDKNIIIWCLDETENKYKLNQICKGHDFSVIGLVYLNNDKLISASIDESIKIWQRNKYNLFINKISIKGHNSGITGLVSINNDTLITYSWDKSIKIWLSSSKNNIIYNNENKKENNNVSHNENNKNSRKESVEYLVQNSINELTNKKDNINIESEKQNNNKINIDNNQKVK